MTTRTPLALLVGVSCLVGASVPSARARTLRHDVDGQEGKLVVPVRAGQPVVLSFHNSAILEIRPSADWKMKYEPFPGAGIIIHTSELEVFNATVTAAARRIADEDIARLEAAHARKLQEKNAEHREEIEAVEAKHKRRVAVAWEQGVLTERASSFGEVPLVPTPCHGDGVVLCEAEVHRAGKGALVRFQIRNRTGSDVPITGVGIFGRDAGKDLAGSARISEGAVARSDDVLGVIPGGVNAIAWVYVSEYDRLGQTFRIALNGAASVLPVVIAYGVRWCPGDDPDEYSRCVQEKWAERARAERERDAKRVSLHVLASYGAIWLASGMDGVDDAEATSLTGLGVRVTMGMTPAIAVEVDVIGATSGTANFSDVNAMGDDLTRSAKLGRVQFGGVLRRGDKIVPMLRAGIGMQVISQDAALMTAGGEMPGPDTGIDVAGSVYGGAGVDFMLGSNLVAGIGFTFTASQLDQRTIDLSINLAYRWDAPR